MEPLHDQDDGGAVGIVQAGWHRTLEPVNRRLTHGLGRRALDAVRVIDDHSVTTSTSDGTRRYGLSEARGCGFELGLGILVACELDGIAPPFLIPLGLDEPPHLGRVSDGEIHRVRGADVAEVRQPRRTPLPRRPEHVDDQALHRARRNVDQEPIVIAFVVHHDAIGNGLEAVADQVNVPVVDILLPRLYYVPRLGDELGEA